MSMGAERIFGRIRFCRFCRRRCCSISSGITALVPDILGRRKGYERATYRIHNIPFVVLGATILWFGWFGFNAGSSESRRTCGAHFMTSAIVENVSIIYHGCY